MILREVDLDLFYIPPPHLRGENVSSVDMRLDYKWNFRERRSRFSFATRCMMSMIGRLMKRIDTPETWKLYFECVEEGTEASSYIYDGCKISDLCYVQLPINEVAFWKLSDYEKKVFTVDKVIEGLDKLTPLVPFDLSSVYDACEEVKQSDYVNERFWKKSARRNKKRVQILLKHEVKSTDLYMVFTDTKRNVIDEVFLTSTLPDEFIFMPTLGDLKWVTDTKAVLIPEIGQRLYGEISSDGSHTNCKKEGETFHTLWGDSQKMRLYKKEGEGKFLYAETCIDEGTAIEHIGLSGDTGKSSEVSYTDEEEYFESFHRKWAEKGYRAFYDDQDMMALVFQWPQESDNYSEAEFIFHERVENYLRDYIEGRGLGYVLWIWDTWESDTEGLTMVLRCYVVDIANISDELIPLRPQELDFDHLRIGVAPSDKAKEYDLLYSAYPGEDKIYV